MIDHSKKSQLLFLCYWGLNDGLTHSSVIPHLKILSASDKINKIVLVTIERDTKTPDFDKFNLGDKVDFCPFFSDQKLGTFFTKFDDFIKIPGFLKKISKEISIDYVIARGSSAGNLAYLLYRKTKLPFYVESFEPLADIMRESFVWKKTSIRFFLQKFWERRQKKHASGLITVSNNYQKKLIQEGISPQKIQVAPCAVDISRFAFNNEDRQTIRLRMKIPPEAIVGIYLGKFEGIYFGREAFDLFKKAFDTFNNFYLFLLTPNNQDWVRTQCENAGLDLSRVTITTVPHENVPEYLSASDFAFSLIKPSPVKAYCSPIKNGEYWANGLPVILPYGVGDDSDILKETKLGALYDIANDNIEECLVQIRDLLQTKDSKNLITGLAARERGFDKVEVAYRYFKII